MPEAADFLAGFGLIQGTEIAGYRLDHVDSTHVAIKRYQEYRYDITLEFTNLGSGNYNGLVSGVRSLISGERIIYGIRNPYRCVIDSNMDIQNMNKTVGFHLVGHSYRTKK